METLFHAFGWFVNTHYLIIGMLVVAAIIVYVETTKVCDTNE